MLIIQNMLQFSGCPVLMLTLYFRERTAEMRYKIAEENTVYNRPEKENETDKK